MTEMAEKALTDCHVHLAALPEGDNGCYISPRMLRSPWLRLLLWSLGLSPHDPRAANEGYVQVLLDELRASRYVGKAVLLAMDGVYDEAGRYDPRQTEFLVSNDYVLKVAGAHPDAFLPGVSINPQRRDAVDELHRCADAGAVLVKVLPNTQQFDPASPRYKSFYRALEERKLPLLSHVGYEFALFGKDQSLGDPGRLRTPLDEGVTVIGAHGCSYGLMVYEKFFGTFQALVRNYSRFYADVSALSLLNRFTMLLRLRRHPELQERLLFGTDFPLPVLHVPAWGRVPLRALGTLVRTDNRFDRMYLLCRHLGLRCGTIEQLRASSNG